MCGTNPKVKTLNPLSRKEEPFQKFSNYMKKPNSLSTRRVSKEAHICEGICLFAAKVGNSFGFKYTNLSSSQFHIWSSNVEWL